MYKDMDNKKTVDNVARLCSTYYIINHIKNQFKNQLSLPNVSGPAYSRDKNTMPIWAFNFCGGW